MSGNRCPDCSRAGSREVRGVLGRGRGLEGCWGVGGATTRGLITPVVTMEDWVGETRYTMGWVRISGRM